MTETPNDVTAGATQEPMATTPPIVERCDDGRIADAMRAIAMLDAAGLSMSLSSFVERHLRGPAAGKNGHALWQWLMRYAEFEKRFHPSRYKPVRSVSSRVRKTLGSAFDVEDLGKADLDRVLMGVDSVHTRNEIRRSIKGMLLFAGKTLDVDVARRDGFRCAKEVLPIGTGRSHLAGGRHEAGERSVQRRDAFARPFCRTSQRRTDMGALGRLGPCRFKSAPPFAGSAT